MFKQISRSSLLRSDAGIPLPTSAGTNSIHLSLCECSKNNRGGCCNNRENYDNRSGCCNPSEVQRKHSGISKCSRGIGLNEKLSYRHLHPRQSYGINFAQVHDNCVCAKENLNCVVPQVVDVSQFDAPVSQCYQQVIQHVQQPGIIQMQTVVQQEGLQDACPPQQCQPGVKYFEMQQSPPTQCYAEQQPCPPPNVQCFEQQCPQAQRTPVRVELETPCTQTPHMYDQKVYQDACQQISINSLHQQQVPCQQPIIRNFDNCQQPLSHPISQSISTSFHQPHGTPSISVCNQGCCDPSIGGYRSKNPKRKCDCKKIEKKMHKDFYKKQRELVITKSKAHSINFSEMYNPPGCAHDDCSSHH